MNALLIKYVFQQNLEKPTWQTKEELYKKKLEQNLQQRELLENKKKVLNKKEGFIALP